MFTWFFSTFSANGLKRKITTVKNIPELYKYIAPDQIDIPPFVSDYDLKVSCSLSLLKLANLAESATKYEVMPPKYLRILLINAFSTKTKAKSYRETDPIFKSFFASINEVGRIHLISS